MSMGKQNIVKELIECGYLFKDILLTIQQMIGWTLTAEDVTELNEIYNELEVQNV